MSWYPFEYQGVLEYQRNERIDLGTSSDEAAKHFDAFVTGIVLSEEDPAYRGGGAYEACISADPNWKTPKIISSIFASLGNEKQTYAKNQELLSSINPSQLNEWERGHYETLKLSARGDWFGAALIMDEHLFKYPRDQAALMSGYFLSFYCGRKHLMRDMPARVVQYYKQQDRFYGSVMGKLCFGYEEAGQIEAAEEAGMIALSHTPKDIWTIHSMSHVKDAKHTPLEGIDFLYKCQPDWSDFERKGAMASHVWWHLALFHIENGDFEEALSLYDERISRYAMDGKSPNGLLMSDATSLLLRLEMEGGCKTQDGTDLKARWRELGEYLKNFHADKVGTNFFYDIHVLIGLLLDEHFCRLPPDIAHPKIAPKILSPDTECSAWNSKVTGEVGSAVLAGLTAFCCGDWATAADKLSSVRHALFENLYGSDAQQEILKLVMLRSAVRAGKDRRELAKQLLEEHVASSYKGHRSNVSQRIQTDIVANF